MAEDISVGQAGTLSDSDSSEASCTDEYFSEDDIVCSLVKYGPASSDSEQDCTEQNMFPAWCLGYSEKLEILNLLNCHSKEQLILCPGSARDYLSMRFPELLNALYSLNRKGTTVAYVTSSLLSDLQSKKQTRRPKSLLGDVCLLNPNDPVKLLTFVSVNDKYQGVIKYNSQTARTLSQTVEQDASLDISIVSGVFMKEEWRSKLKFVEKVGDLECIAKKVEIPDTLDMNIEKQRKIVTSLLSKVSSDGRVFSKDGKCCKTNFDTESNIRLKLEFPVHEKGDFMQHKTDEQWAIRFGYTIYIHEGFGSHYKKIPPSNSTANYCDMCKRKSPTDMGLVQCTLCYEIGCQECNKYYAPRRPDTLRMKRCCVRCFREKTSNSYCDTDASLLKKKPATQISDRN